MKIKCSCGMTFVNVPDAVRHIHANPDHVLKGWKEEKRR